MLTWDGRKNCEIIPFRQYLPTPTQISKGFEISESQNSKNVIFLGHSSFQIRRNHGKTLKSVDVRWPEKLWNYPIPPIFAHSNPNFERFRNFRISKFQKRHILGPFIIPNQKESRKNIKKCWREMAGKIVKLSHSANICPLQPKFRKVSKFQNLKIPKTSYSWAIHHSKSEGITEKH